MFHIELKNWLDYSKNVFFSDSKPLAKFLRNKYYARLVVADILTATAAVTF
jgi:hypothetical protein